MKTVMGTAAAALVLAAPLVLVSAGPAGAHGSLDSPVSRSYVCYQEGPENPLTDVCAAVVAAGGTQPLYDWMEVNIGDAAGRHRQIIPDGRLCSAGRDKYRGLDLARTDWPATSLPSGADFTFRYRATAPHQGGFEFYVTRDGYDPAEPLAWDDLEPEPFHVEPSPSLVDGYYLMDVTLPQKQGRHLIYAIWQRTDSPEAFYACSDVVFEDGSASDGSNGSDADGSSGDGTSGSSSGGDGDTGSADDPATCGPGAGIPSSGTEPDADDHSDDSAGYGHHPAGGHEQGSDAGDASGAADRGGRGQYAGFWAALFSWLGRLHQWAETSPGFDNTVLTSSVVPVGNPSQGQGAATPQVVVGLVAAAMGIAFALARPTGRGRHRRQPAHRR